MWLRYAILNWWVLHQMPLVVQQEFLYLRAYPSANTARFNQLVDTWFGQSYSDPSITSTDWGLLGVLVVVIVPIMITLGLRAAKPLSTQFSELAQTAKAVTRGQFNVTASKEQHVPQELLQLTDDFNTMTRQLQQYDRELKASHVALAHELRSPLTAAIGRLQGMLDGVFEPNPKQLNMVMAQLQHLNQLVRDLHFLSLMTAQQLNLNKQPICLAELIQQKIQWLSPQLIHFEIDNQVAKTVLCVDPLRLGQLITIILENALRYAKEGKKMTITSWSEQHYIYVSFKDNGQGVPNEFLDTIFQKFTRAEASRARHLGGTGLGLSIATAIAHAHNGCLVARNHPEGGARDYFEFASILIRS